MKITIYAKEIKLTSELEDYVNQKIGGLKHIIDDVIETWVELDEKTSERSGNKYRCEVQMRMPRFSIRAVETTTDIHAAIDLVIPKLKKQIERFKSKHEELRTKRGIKKLRD